jgi:hypothetical protein
MISMRRAVAAILLAVIAGAGLAPTTCFGWEGDRAERMACCQRAGHDCPDQTAADDCCAQQEQANQPAAGMSATIFEAPAALPAAVAPALDLMSLAPPTSKHHDRSPARQLHAPPGSFAQSLRI